MRQAWGNNGRAGMRMRLGAGPKRKPSLRARLAMGMRKEFLLRLLGHFRRGAFSQPSGQDAGQLGAELRACGTVASGPSALAGGRTARSWAHASDSLRERPALAAGDARACQLAAREPDCLGAVGAEGRVPMASSRRCLSTLACRNGEGRAWWRAWCLEREGRAETKWIMAAH